MPVENNPYFHKIIGLPTDTREELKEKLDAFITKGVETAGGEFIEGYELKKTPEDVHLIDFTTAHVDQLAEKYGYLKPTVIPLDNIHILKKGGTEAVTESSMDGAYSPKLHRILIDQTDAKTEFCMTLFHELVHAKSYSALQLTETSHRLELLPYRSGMEVFSRDGKKVFLTDITEAVTEYLTEEFYKDVLLKDPEFETEKDTLPPDKVRIRELADFDEMVKKIRAAHQDEYSTDRAVVDEFIQAQFSGKLFKIARLIKEVNGDDGIRQSYEIG